MKSVNERGLEEAFNWLPTDKKLKSFKDLIMLYMKCKDPDWGV